MHHLQAQVKSEEMHKEKLIPPTVLGLSCRKEDSHNHHLIPLSKAWEVQLTLTFLLLPLHFKNKIKSYFRVSDLAYLSIVDDGNLNYQKLSGFCVQLCYQPGH